MHKINGANPGPGNTFVEGDPLAGTPATQVTEAWLDAVQAELVKVVEDSGQVLSTSDNAQVQKALNIYARPARLYRNALINGDFGLWQRPTSGSGKSLTVGQTAYGSDRWLFSPGTGGSAAANVARAASPVAERLIHGSRFYLLFGQTTAGTSPFLEQRIEDVMTFTGQKVVLSFYADVIGLGSGTTLSIATEFVQNFGSGGSSSVVTAGSTTVVPLAGGWARYEVSVTIPSVAAKTWPVNLSTAMYGHYLSVRFKFPSALTFTVALASVQFELGSTASDYQTLPDTIEKQRACRYYQTSVGTNWVDGAQSYDDQSGPVNTFASGVEARPLNTRFPVPMRAIPTITWLSPRSPFSSGKIWWNGAERTVIGTNSTHYSATGSPVIGASQSLSECEAHYEADAEL